MVPRWVAILWVLLGCTHKTEGGHVLVSLTVAWEGAELDPAEIASLATLRREAPGAPITHFVCPAYVTRPSEAGEPTLAPIAAAIADGDQVAVHVHAWSSLMTASGVTPKPSPSFFTGTDKLLPTGSDPGYDTDLDAYTIPEIRAVVRTSRRLLAPLGFPISPTFRAAGYLATPKVREALVEEHFAIDSSAIGAAVLHAAPKDPFAARVGQLWPDVGVATQPFVIKAPGGELREVPIAALLSSTSSDELAAQLSAAFAQVERDPDHDVLVVIELDLETASEVIERFGAALRTLPETQRDALRYVTIDQGAAFAGDGRAR